ncbi:oxidoreductase tpcJ [Aspergillus novofumigatus IBT 16806]|uniref:Multicopper oxidase n=1 Tax=Aspergillus novofumigatus (strain IBT 16806) TaxID=1392255 RepID=A0A2I1CJN6_ASPN1|nr:multicopper oxidase [Aspergillus novofumigatus IBT 16806]PKX97829.1 multicopper oxidase [Aspergillus novofumigatus IBT 16806]
MQLKLYVISLIRYFGFTSLIGLDSVDQAPLLKGGNTTAEETSSTPPIFVPPGTGKDNRIKCNYTGLPGWWHPDSPDLRGVWLRNNKTGHEYNITTDYETSWPQGVRRDYHIVVSNDTTANWDGIPFPGAKMINGTFPGPWIHVTVTNNLTYNGTAIHMHGLRMLENNLMDGVPGVTQCPIAPGGSFTYKFRATQYGTTWYHSHYSLQYSDGMYGPLTIHGPTSANWDESIDPILLGDHNHRSAFQDYYQEQFSGKSRAPPKMTSILINGNGHKRYLLRLINTSTDTTYVFAIDSHNFTVIESDLVPIEPYETDHLAIGIGQRYHVVLNTWPEEQRNGTNEFWIRTVPADHCNNFADRLDVRQGILCYKGYKCGWPTTSEGEYNYTCRDEPPEKLRPIIPWIVPSLRKGEKDDIDLPISTIMLANWSLPAEPPDIPSGPVVNNWHMMNHTLWVNYSEPTVNNLDGPFGDNAVVYPVDKNPLHNEWNYMVIIGGKEPNLGPPKGGRLIPAAHPIHLHGHDFALLQQSNYIYKGPSSLNLTYNNPPRRDVVLLPKGGFVVIAFKADNPGAWAFHCHIAWHASAGLAFQILESKNDFKHLMDKQPHNRRQLDRTCRRWNEWRSNPDKFWHPKGRFQDDSGI